MSFPSGTEKRRVIELSSDEEEATRLTGSRRWSRLAALRKTQSAKTRRKTSFIPVVNELSSENDETLSTPGTEEHLQQGVAALSFDEKVTVDKRSDEHSVIELSSDEEDGEEKEPTVEMVSSDSNEEYSDGDTESEDLGPNDGESSESDTSAASDGGSKEFCRASADYSNGDDPLYLPTSGRQSNFKPPTALRRPRTRKATKEFFKAANVPRAYVPDNKAHWRKGESSERRPNRKLAGGWTRAGGNCSPTPVVASDRNYPRPAMQHNSVQEKDRNASNEVSDPATKGSAATKGAVATRESFQDSLQVSPLSTDADEVAQSSRSDHNMSLTLLHYLAHPAVSGDKQTGRKESSQGHEPHRSTAHGEFDFDGTTKPLIDSLDALEDTVKSINVLTGWFSREKICCGNQLSITLSDEEMRCGDDLKGRITLAKDVLDQINAHWLSISRPNWQADLMTWLAMYKTVVEEEIHPRINRTLPAAKEDSESAVEHITESVENAVNAIMEACN